MTANYFAFGPAGPNLLTNPSFEAGLSGWHGSDAGGPTAIARSTAQAYSGSASLALSHSSGGAQVGAYAGSAHEFPVAAGQTYAVTARLRGATAGRDARVYLLWDTGGALVGGPSGPLVADTTTGWTLATAVRAAPPGAAWAWVGVWVYGLGAGEVHYVDDVALREVALPGTLAYSAVRDPLYAGDDSGDPLADQVYRHAGLLLSLSIGPVYQGMRGAFAWPTPDGDAVVPLTGTPAASGTGPYDAGRYSFASYTAGPASGTVRQMLGGSEGGTRKVPAVLDLLAAATAGQRSTIASSLASTRAAVDAAYAALRAANAAAAVGTAPQVEAARQFGGRVELAAVLGAAAATPGGVADEVQAVGGYNLSGTATAGAAAYLALSAVVAREAGLVGVGPFNQAAYDALVAPLKSAVILPSGY